MKGAVWLAGPKWHSWDGEERHEAKVKGALKGFHTGCEVLRELPLCRKYHQEPGCWNMEWGRVPGSDVSESSEEAGGVMSKGADGRTERVKGGPGPT